MTSLFPVSRKTLAWVFGVSSLLCASGSAVAALALDERPSAQVAIEIKLVELPEGSVENLELLGMLGVPNDAAGTALAARAGLPGNAIGEPLRGIYSGSSTNPVGLTWTISDSRSQAILKAFERRNSVVISSPPRLTTSSGRKARIEVANLPRATVPTTTSWSQLRVADPNFFFGLPGVKSGELDPIIDLLPELQPDGYPFLVLSGVKSGELDPIIDLFPEVQSDGSAIRLTVTPLIKEFIGYDLSPRSMIWDYEPSPISGQRNPSMETIPIAIRPQGNEQIRPPSLAPLDLTTPAPIFQTRSVASSAVVQDGQTLVLGSLPAKNIAIPPPEKIRGQAGTTFRQIERANPEIKSLFIFVTTRLVDANGKPVHADKE